MMRLIIRLLRLKKELEGTRELYTNRPNTDELSLKEALRGGYSVNINLL